MTLEAQQLSFSSPALGGNVRFGVWAGLEGGRPQPRRGVRSSLGRPPSSCPGAAHIHGEHPPPQTGGETAHTVQGAQRDSMDEVIRAKVGAYPLGPHPSTGLSLPLTWTYRRLSSPGLGLPTIGAAPTAHRPPKAPCKQEVLSKCEDHQCRRDSSEIPQRPRSPRVHQEPGRTALTPAPAPRRGWSAPVRLESGLCAVGSPSSTRVPARREGNHGRATRSPRSEVLGPCPGGPDS